MNFLQRNNPDSKRPANPTEEQDFPFILDGQNNEPVNFAGIPLRLLKPFPSELETTIEWEIVTNKLETRRYKITGDFYGHVDTSEEAVINDVLLHREEVIAFFSHTSTRNKVTGKVWKERQDSPCPYVRVGRYEWTNVCPITGEREETFTVSRKRR